MGVDLGVQCFGCGALGFRLAQDLPLVGERWRARGLMSDVRVSTESHEKRKVQSQQPL